MALRKVDLPVHVVAHALALGIESRLVLSYTSSSFGCEELLAALVQHLLATSASSSATLLRLSEGLRDGLPNLSHDPLVLLWIQQLLRIKAADRFQNRTEGTLLPGALLLEHAQRLEHRTEVAPVLGNTVRNIVPVAHFCFINLLGCSRRRRWSLVRRVVIRFVLLHPLLGSLPRPLVPLLYLGASDVQRNLGSNRFEELRVHAFCALLDATLDFYKHVVQLVSALRGEELVDVGHYAFRDTSAETA
mmetsp:Transcript_14932/g.32804  ORF Transcript_14932/g.32804 Transcript_14932/m.32804 type:complete len:247 (-) Transcript_14932:962-1702(-)